MAGTPIPPIHYYPSTPYPQMAPQGNTGQVLDDVNNLLAGISPTEPKPKKSAKQDTTAEAKKKIPVETKYEGYSVQRLSPNVGDAKTWSKVALSKLPFDNAKLYKDAMLHKSQSGVGVSKIYDGLLVNQQGVIDRIIAKKMMAEKNPDALWTLFDVYKVKQDFRISTWRVVRETVRLIITLRCQDKSKSTMSDKPPGTTANPDKFVGEIIDLSVPLKAPEKKEAEGGADGKKKEKKKKEKKNPVGDVPDVLDGLDGHQIPPAPPSHDQPYPQAVPDPFQGYGPVQQGYVAPHQDQQQLPQPNQPWDPNPPAQQPAYGQQAYNSMPHAPMAPQTAYGNPMTPMVGVPEQYMPPAIDNRPYNDYSARRLSRSRSRDRHHSRPRSSSRHRQRHHHHHHHHHTPSTSSSEYDDGFWSRPASAYTSSAFTPPQSPEIDHVRLHRRGSKQQAYHHEARTLYPDERYYAGREHRREAPPLAYRTRRQPAIWQDDYPGARQHYITDYPQGLEDARYYRRESRGEGEDFLRDPVRGSGLRHDDRYARPSGARRYSGY